MPNGGSDCCGTCWFNSVNDGTPGYPDKQQFGLIRCEIRDFAPGSAFWTYCANHPHHNPKKIRTPIGPVYVCDAGYPYQRIEKMKAPDSEQIRQQLLQLVEQIPAIPAEEYPSETSFSLEIVKHIQYLNERRSVPLLKRILEFDPFAGPSDTSYGDNNVDLISQTLECLAELDPQNAMTAVSPWITFGIEDTDTDEYDAKKDRAAPLRYHAVRALKSIDSEAVLPLLEQALNDPHAEIRAFAAEIKRLKTSA